MHLKNMVTTKAFTLAETLLTMLIIGVIGVVTIPSILQSYQEQATVAKVKETYSILRQAFKMAEAENGLPSTWGLSQFHTMDNVLPYLRIQKCSDGGGCFSNTYKNMDGTPNTNLVDIDTSSSFPKFRLSNGVTLFTSHVNKDCLYSIPNGKACFWIRVDLNADNPPNAQGVDLFGFYVTNEGVSPLDDSGHYGTVYCSKSRANYSYLSGISCAYVIMQQGNMDYLHP